MRLFAAVSIGSARERVADILRELRRTGADYRWVRAENLHLTLAFLGSVEDSRAAAAAGAVRRAAAGRTAFEARLSGLGAFPSAKDPRVVWLGVSQGSRELAELAGALEGELAAAGVPAQDAGREFKAHLTLGRMKGKARLGALEALLEARPSPPEPPAFRVDRLILFRSRLGPGGAEYAELESAALAGPGGGA